jgi:hypothetical protein
MVATESVHAVSVRVVVAAIDRVRVGVYTRIKAYRTDWIEIEGSEPMHCRRLRGGGAAIESQAALVLTNTAAVRSAAPNPRHRHPAAPLVVGPLELGRRSPAAKFQ